MSDRFIPRGLAEDLLRESAKRMVTRIADELTPQLADLIAAGQLVEGEVFWTAGVDRIIGEVGAEVRERMAELEVEGSA